MYISMIILLMKIRTRSLIIIITIKISKDTLVILLYRDIWSTMTKLFIFLLFNNFIQMHLIIISIYQILNYSLNDLSKSI